MQAAFQMIIDLDKESTPLICYVQPEQTKSQDIKAVLMRSLLEALSDMQNSMIDKYMSLSEYGKTITGTTSSTQINIMKAPKSTLLRLKSDIVYDLEAHSNMIEGRQGQESKLEVNIDYLVSKYSEELFRGAMLMKVSPNFHFKDDAARSIDRLLQ